MQRKLFKILITLILLSCNSNKEIEGTWISAYTLNNESNQPIGFPIRQIINFKGEKFKIRDFKYDYLSEENLKQGNYSYKFNKLTCTIDREEIKIDLINKTDSLIFEEVRGTSNLFKKIDPFFKSDIKENLSEKSFLYKSENYLDTIHFINDSILKYSNDESNNLLKWERFKFNDFDILFIEFDIPYILTKSKNDNLLITGFHQKKYEIELVEIKE